MSVWNEYQDKCAATAVYPDVGRNIAYPALGLAGEAGELLGAVASQYMLKQASHDAIYKEAGDCLWYHARIASEAQVQLQLVVDMMPDIQHHAVDIFECARAISAMCSVAEIVKKCIRDNGGQIDERVRSKLVMGMAKSMRHLKNLLEDKASQHWKPISLEEVAIMNIAKLQDRAQRGVLQGSGDNR